MKNKLMLLTAASAFSMAGIAADYTNSVLINLDDVGYGDFSFNGAYGYTTPNIDKMAADAEASGSPANTIKPVSQEDMRAIYRSLI